MNNNNIETKVNVFLGNCVHAANGEWISLPMEDSKLKETINSITKKYGEIIISDYSKEVDYLDSLDIKEHSDIFELNYILKQPKEFIALYIDGCEDLEFANDMWRRGEYLYVPNVENLVELGEAIAELGIIKGMNKDLIDAGYIDFEQIGIDFECYGITLYKGIGAIGQISNREYLKWINCPINVKSKSLTQYLLENGAVPENIDNHESDLYIKIDSNIDTLLSRFEDAQGYKLSKKIFIDNISKTEWYDIPFGYMIESYNNRYKGF